MKILFLLTRPMVDKCFASADLARLSRDHEVILPAVDQMLAVAKCHPIEREVLAE